MKALACGVCRTDLHVVDGELPDPMLPIIPGHEIVGRIDAIGTGVKDLQMGERVRLGHTDGSCPYCMMHRENLCDHPLFTGFTRYGGVGALVPLALKAVRKGGRVVCAGIHMSDIPSFPYSILWEERKLLSVANLTRKDGIDFLRVTPQTGIKVTTNQYPLRQANEALADLRGGRFEGAAVIIADS